MYKCLDCGVEMEIDPDDYEIDDMMYCENCGAAHLVVGVDDEEAGIRCELLDEDK